MQCAACQQRGKTWEGSDPKCAFAGGEWSPDNWNCATTGLLRGLFDDPGVDIEGRSHHWNNDQHAAMLDVLDAAVHDRPVSLWMTWYKSRGRTEQVWLMFDDQPPRRPTEAEVLAVCSAHERDYPDRS